MISISYKKKIIMEKLTEKINSFTVSKTMKDVIQQIAYEEHLQIQQVCRRLLAKAIKEYIDEEKNKTLSN